MHISGSTPVERMAHLKAQAQRLCQQRNKISGAPQDLNIIAISKGQGKEKIEPLLASGHRVFGENRVGEAIEKWTDLKEKFAGVELHFVGALQSNKVDEACHLFDFIHALDRPKLATALKQKQAEGVRVPKLFIQVNVGAEEQKAGIDFNEAPDFIRSCLADGLPVIGLMALPPMDKNPAPYFAMLKNLAAAHGLPHLSMGMSQSLEAAILLGATFIRPGTIIFGARD